MPIALDGSAVASSNSATNVTASLTTTSTNDIIIAIVSVFGNQAAPTISDTGGASLTWNTRVNNIFSGSNNMRFTYAYAKSAGALTADPIKATIAAATFISLAVFGVSGADQTTIFDPVTLTNKTGTTGGTASVAFSTSHADDMIIGLEGDANVGNTFTPGSGYTLIQDEHVAGTGVDAVAQYKIVSTMQSGVTQSMTWPGGSDWVMIADAIMQATTNSVILYKVTGT